MLVLNYNELTFENNSIWRDITMFHSTNSLKLDAISITFSYISIIIW